MSSLAAIEKIRATEGQGVIDAVDVTCGLSLGEYTALTFAGESWVLGGRVQPPRAGGWGCGLSLGEYTALTFAGESQTRGARGSRI